MQRIFVGDVQACGEELREIVRRAERQFGDQFELWLVGDLVNRGPRNRQVLETVRDLWERSRAFPILGNHELALLRLAFGLREESRDDTFQEILAAPDAAAWTDWIRGWPLIRTFPLGDRPVAMIHAAAAPGWSLAELKTRAAGLEARLRASRNAARQLLVTSRRDSDEADDLERMTRCRSAALDGSWTSKVPDRPEGAWHVAWAEAAPGYRIVYGHWALQGLHQTADLRGLDTGCVYHGNGRDGFLTAWLPDAELPNPFASFDTNLWQVRARRRYWSP